MTRTFHDFWKQHAGLALPDSGEAAHVGLAFPDGSEAASLTTAARIAQLTAAATVQHGLFPDDDVTRERFASEVSKATTSDEIIVQLSERIGAPRPSETEDEFVERATTALRAVLYEHFGVAD